MDVENQDVLLEIDRYIDEIWQLHAIPSIAYDQLIEAERLISRGSSLSDWESLIEDHLITVSASDLRCFCTLLQEIANSHLEIITLFWERMDQIPIGATTKKIRLFLIFLINIVMNSLRVIRESKDSPQGYLPPTDDFLDLCAGASACYLHLCVIRGGNRFQVYRPLITRVILEDILCCIQLADFHGKNHPREVKLTREESSACRGAPNSGFKKIPNMVMDYENLEVLFKAVESIATLVIDDSSDDLFEMILPVCAKMMASCSTNWEHILRICSILISLENTSSCLMDRKEHYNTGTMRDENSKDEDEEESMNGHVTSSSHYRRLMILLMKFVPLITMSSRDQLRQVVPSKSDVALRDRLVKWLVDLVQEECNAWMLEKGIVRETIRELKKKEKKGSMRREGCLDLSQLNYDTPQDHEEEVDEDMENDEWVEEEREIEVDPQVYLIEMICTTCPDKTEWRISASKIAFLLLCSIPSSIITHSPPECIPLKSGSEHCSVLTRFLPFMNTLATSARAFHRQISIDLSVYIITCFTHRFISSFTQVRTGDMMPEICPFISISKVNLYSLISFILDKTNDSAAAVRAKSLVSIVKIFDSFRSLLMELPPSDLEHEMRSLTDDEQSGDLPFQDSYTENTSCDLDEKITCCIIYQIYNRLLSIIPSTLDRFSVDEKAVVRRSCMPFLVAFLPICELSTQSDTWRSRCDSQIASSLPGPIKDLLIRLSEDRSPMVRKEVMKSVDELIISPEDSNNKRYCSHNEYKSPDDSNLLNRNLRDIIFRDGKMWTECILPRILDIEQAVVDSALQLISCTLFDRISGLRKCLQKQKQNIVTGVQHESTLIHIEDSLLGYTTICEILRTMGVSHSAAEYGQRAVKLLSRSNKEKCEALAIELKEIIRLVVPESSTEEENCFMPFGDIMDIKVTVGLFMLYEEASAHFHDAVDPYLALRLIPIDLTDCNNNSNKTSGNTSLISTPRKDEKERNIHTSNNPHICDVIRESILCLRSERCDYFPRNLQVSAVQILKTFFEDTSVSCNKSGNSGINQKDLKTRLTRLLFQYKITDYLIGPCFELAFNDASVFTENQKKELLLQGECILCEFVLDPRGFCEGVGSYIFTNDSIKLISSAENTESREGVCEPVNTIHCILPVAVATILTRVCMTIGDTILTINENRTDYSDSGQPKVLSALQAIACQGGLRDGEWIITAPQVLMCQAMIAIGKFALKRESIAHSHLNFFVGHLSSDAVPVTIRNCVMTIVTDLAMNYTHMIEQFSSVISLSLVDRHVFFRKQTLLNISTIVAEDYFKFKGTLVPRLITMVADDDSEIRAITEAVFNTILLRRDQYLFRNIIVDMACALNGYKGNSHYTLARGNSKFACPNTYKKRESIYRFMLKSIDTIDQKLYVVMEIVTKFISSFLDEDKRRSKIPLPIIESDPCNNVIIDCCRLLISSDLRLGRRTSDSTGDLDRQQDEVETTDEAVENRMSTVIKETLIPVLLELLHELERIRSPLQSSVMRSLSVLISDFRSDIRKLCGDDTCLEHEILVNINKLHGKNHSPFSLDPTEYSIVEESR